MTLVIPAAGVADRLSPVWPRFTDLDVERGEGAWLFAASGRRYLDFTSGIGVTNTGHCHPRVVEAVRRQAGRLMHAQVTIARHDALYEVAEELATVVPQELDCFFLASSGSEAVESALKLARHATGRGNVVCFQGGYHGRSVGAMSITTAKTVYRGHYLPLMAGVHVAPFPYAFRHRRDPEELSRWCLAELEHLLATQSAPGETAALVVEPVLGEGGYVVPPHSFLRGLRELCDRHGILLVFDEIQTGFGRTGAMFALEHPGVVPDILVMAKGLASGLPLSAIAAPRALMEKWVPGSHGGTYCASAVPCAAAAETIRVIRDEGLVENARARGESLRRRLNAVRQRLGAPAEVRGVGLMVGCEFATPAGLPDRALARRVREGCLDAGLLLLTCGTQDQVIRWIPPLVVTEAQVLEAVGIFEAALAAALGS
ncbi:MAG: Gamma-aminobutyrate:alpha-ketoglutarate aminotransferase [uncultured Gemmatimonadetes bacterium]|uniref:Gamma-aminobutyrate:alpha-ketoglutarate aminotransferase n=1 Tax=uncultured Gemmatimonadota bacterium TaxID=203437 RepID=A0A6J4KHT3_9BACT|nr:MAG: Gamma-aminobutyrate:alpha-ketoglutarate aminotransferase [uncultured Gemmatimonadota bacterium]